jgi:hypothetical protein
METAGRKYTKRKACLLVRALSTKETKHPKQDPQKLHHKTAGDSGAFGDDGRHAPALYCLQVNVERVNERPGIWRPLDENIQNAKRVYWYVLCRPRKRNTRSRTRRNYTIKQRVIRVLSVTTGGSVNFCFLL